MPGIGSVLSWHIGMVADGTPTLGMTHNHSDRSDSGSGESKECYGTAGDSGGGPFLNMDNHSSKDIHVTGTTKDGEDIAPLHLTTQTLFHMKHDRREVHKGNVGVMDGQLHFEEVVHNLPFPKPYDCRTHLNWEPENFTSFHDAYGGKIGKWYWWTETSIGGSIPPEPPAEPPPEVPPPPYPPTEAPPPPPTRDETPKRVPVTTHPSKPTDKTEDPVNQVTNETTEYQQSHLYHAWSCSLAKPVPNDYDDPHMGDYSKPVSDEQILDWTKKAPIVGVLDSFYGYTGKNWDQPTYNQEPIEGNLGNAFRSGTSDGGFYIMPPELNLLQVRDQNSTGTHPAPILNATASNTKFGFAPGVEMFFGYPNLDDGSIKNDAWKCYVNTSNNLKYDIVESGGTTNLLQYPKDSTTEDFIFSRGISSTHDIYTDADFYFKSDTAFKTTFEHNNDADRVATYQNSSGTVAWLSDISSGEWTNTANDLTMTTGTTASFPDGSTVPIIRGETDTDTGFSIASNNIYFWTGSTRAAIIDSSQNLSIVGLFRSVDHATIPQFTGTTDENTGMSIHTDTLRLYTGGTIAIEIDSSQDVVFAGDIRIPSSATVPTIYDRTDGDTGLSTNLDNIYFYTGGTEALNIDSSQDATFANDVLATNRFSWLDGGSYKGILAQSNTGSDKTYTFPNETAQVKMKKDKVKFWPWAVPSIAFGDYATRRILDTASYRTTFMCPDDFVSLTSLVMVFIASTTDTTNRFSIASDYGAAGTSHGTHSETANVEVSSTANHIEEISISGAFSSLAALDYCGLDVTNASGFTNYMLGIKMIYTSTD